MTVRRGPDFIIVGAMKCGTTTLHEQLAAQPGIFMTTPKEPNYFSDDEVHARGPDWYADLFGGAGPGDIAGEASTHYTKRPTHPDTVERMAALTGTPRLIYMIRDPVARAVSHYIHGWSRGDMTGTATQAFDRHPELVEYGLYGRQIAPFVDRFGVGAVMLTSLEQMKAGPTGVLSEVARFVGLKGPVEWHEASARANASDERIRRLPLHGLLVDNRVAAALRRALVPQALRDRVKAARRMAERPELPPELVRRLEQRFLADRAELSALFPGHPALDLCYPFARA